MRLMAAPVLAAPACIRRVRFRRSAGGLLAARPAAKDDLLDPEAISAMMQAGQGPDSLHRLVMDLHKRLNAMQAALAEETLDGAAVYGLDAADRPLVVGLHGRGQPHRAAEIRPSGPGHDRHARPAAVW